MIDPIGALASGAAGDVFSLIKYQGLRVDTPGERELRQMAADRKAREADREDDLKTKLELVKLGYVGTINNLHPKENVCNHSYTIRFTLFDSLGRCINSIKKWFYRKDGI